MKTVYFLPLLSAVCLMLFTPSVYSDDGNYQNYIVGERAAGMGGAATALAEGVDACFYNPAGLAETKSNSISLSASLYGFYEYKVQDGWFPNEDVDIDTFVSIPTTFGSIWKISDKASIALSAFIPDRIACNDLETFIDVGHFFKYNEDDQTLWIGPSTGFRLTPELSVGASIFFVYRTFSRFQDLFLANDPINPGSALSLSEDGKYSDLGLLGILAAKYYLDENWSLGLSLQLPSVHLTGDGEYLIKMVRLGVPSGDYVDDADTDNKIPTGIRIGAAYQVPNEYALALDLSYHFPTSYDRMEGRDQWGNWKEWPARKRGTFNVNLGGEYYVFEHYPVRLGFFTNLSNAPKASEEAAYYPAHINKYGITASVGRESEHTTLNLGVNYVWGSGEYVGLDENINSVIVDADASYLFVFLASSYLF